VVRAASEPGDLVVDPFSGSGTTGIAAALLGRRYVGMDLEAKYLRLTMKRYKDLANEPDLETLRQKRVKRNTEKKLSATAVRAAS
jgi:DNA modification methylase